MGPTGQQARGGQMKAASVGEGKSSKESTDPRVRRMHPGSMHLGRMHLGRGPRYRRDRATDDCILCARTQIRRPSGAIQLTIPLSIQLTIQLTRTHTLTAPSRPAVKRNSASTQMESICAVCWVAKLEVCWPLVTSQIRMAPFRSPVIKDPPTTCAVSVRSGHAAGCRIRLGHRPTP
mgnify:CR=1 FL=1